MAHGDAREGKWKRNWRMDWVASTLHTTSEHGVSSITTADAHTSAASNRLNWRPRRFKWTRPFRRKTKYVFCACAITFQTQSTHYDVRTTTKSPYDECRRNVSPSLSDARLISKVQRLVQWTLQVPLLSLFRINCGVKWQFLQNFILLKVFGFQLQVNSNLLVKLISRVRTLCDLHLVKNELAPRKCTASRRFQL